MANPSFETGDLSGYNQIPGANTFTVPMDPSMAESGSYYLLVTPNVPSSESEFVLSQTIQMCTTINYSLTFAALATFVTGGDSCSLHICLGNVCQLVSTDSGTPGVHGYSIYTTTFMGISSNMGTGFASFEVDTLARGCVLNSIQFDNFQLDPILS